MAKRRKWSVSAGSKPHTVVVEEREPGGVLRVRAWDATRRAGQGDWVRRSLKHRDREAAKTHALEQAAKLRKGVADIQQGNVTLAHVIDVYLLHRSKRKGDKEQEADKRRAEMWKRFLGGDTDPHTVSLASWERFIDLRTSGAIEGQGKQVPPEERRVVRTRSINQDLHWLGWVMGWASKWRTPQGPYLMRENPVRGYDIPTEKNPRRAIATEDRFQATRAKTDEVTMKVRWHSKAKTVRSHLSEILDIVSGTGRRLSAVLQLQYEDVQLSEGPHGAIRWPADTDKTGKETVVPIGPDVRTAIDRVLRESPGIGKAYLFPAPGDLTKPVSRHLAAKWLQGAEKLAGLEKLDGSLWHAYRRKWATERKHLPDADVAAAGGWAIQTRYASYTSRQTKTPCFASYWSVANCARRSRQMVLKRPQRAHQRAHIKTAPRARSPKSRLIPTFLPTGAGGFEPPTSWLTARRSAG